MPLVSVIVPCYNQASFLSDALDSVLAQTYTDWECIIVNDGSTDNTEEVAKTYINKDSRFAYVHKNNGGLPSARNFGISKSSGDFILPLDADDLIGSSYLEKAISRFKSFPETKLVYCKAAKFGHVSGAWSLGEYSYDAFICGSDQIWSSYLMNPPYFLSFVPDNKPKIAYAPSFGAVTVFSSPLSSRKLISTDSSPIPATYIGW